MGKANRILVVDDNATNRRILVKSLGDAGYEMLEATDGFEAVEKATSQSPDLILLDIMMPEQDGFDVCSILKSREATATIPVIFLTAKAEQQDIERAFSVGGCDYVTKPFKMREVKARVSVHLQLRQAQIEADLRNEQLEEMSKVVAESNIELARLARIDPLTKLHNRRAWEENVTMEHDRSERNGRAYGIIMIDVDHFKSFNDTFGHQAGDDCLERVAERIRSTCRTTDVVGRYGGEEFVVLAPETEAEAVLALAERLREGVFDLNIPHVASSVANRVTMSLGVATRVSGSWEGVLKEADEALYAAKATGRNNVRANSTTTAKREAPSITKSSPARSDATEPGVDGDRISVLIVDDSATNRMVCRRSLERAGYDIRESVDGEAALEEVTRDPPCVILMDVTMPVMDGLECTQRLRANPETRDIPIIITSARGDASDIQAGLEAGANEYLTRPIRSAELALRVRSMVERRYDRLNLLRSYEMRGEQTRILSILLDLCRVLGTTDSLNSALKRTLEATVDLTGCRLVSIMLPDPRRRFLSIAESIGIDLETASESRVPISETIAGRVLESGSPIVLNSECDIPANQSVHDSQHVSSIPFVCTALGVAERTIGVLSATDRVEKTAFGPQELESIEMIAGIAGTAIQSILTRRARDDARDAIMVAFAKLAEHRDGDTRLHVDRVTKYCLMLAEEIRNTGGGKSAIDDTFMHDLERSVPLHDIGKVAVPDRILLKPGRLTPDEMTIMKTHARIGADTIRTVRDRAPDFSMLKMAEDIASSHHEWYDGTGYPEGLRADDIPLSARLVAVADVYDAVRTKRPYKNAMSHDEAVSIVLKSSGTQFDPTITEAFMRRASEFKTLSEELADSTENHEPHSESAVCSVP